MKYILHYKGLNKKKYTGRGMELVFNTPKDRADAIAGKVIGLPDRVYTLGINYTLVEGDEECLEDLYIFERWACIMTVADQPWRNMYLFEWESYEEALELFKDELVELKMWEW